MNKKLLYGLMIIAIIVGAIMVRVKGYNYTIINSNHTRIEVSLNQDFDLKDVKQIANESFSKDTVVRKTTLFNTSVAVEAKEFKDEEITTFFNKLNEKYGKDYNLKQLKRDDIMIAKNLATTLGTMTDDELNAKLAEIKQEYGLEYTKEELESTDTSVRMTNVSRIRVWDTVKGLALPMLIAAVIVGLYYAIRYRKLYKNAWIIRPVKLAAKLILVLGFILAILVIARIPVGSYLGTLLIMAFIITMLADNYSCELALEKVKEKEDK